MAADSSLDMLVKTIADRIVGEVKTALANDPQTPRVQPVLLGVKEAAVYLGRSEQAIQHLIFDQALPVVRVGRRVHLDRRDLDRWIEANKY